VPQQQTTGESMRLRRRRIVKDSFIFMTGMAESCPPAEK
jgi:hypothetical protein